jgi:hypothetical protein
MAPYCWTRHGTALRFGVDDMLRELAERLPADSVVDGELV